MTFASELMQDYLQATEVIDWNHHAVRARAARLAIAGDAIRTAKACIEFARHEIKHSCDFQMGPVTCRASDVLQHGTGYCYAKSHLLAALLRANGQPDGLCYQRLSLDDSGSAFCLHGYNAVYLLQHGWYRIDGRS
jgi:transglutaminase-like putative cysteine protease